MYLLPQIICFLCERSLDFALKKMQMWESQQLKTCFLPKNQMRFYPLWVWVLRFPARLQKHLEAKNQVQQQQWLQFVTLLPQITKTSLLFVKKIKNDAAESRSYILFK